MIETTGVTILSCEISSLLYPPVSSEGQKGALGRKPWLSAEVWREQRKRAALEDLDLRRSSGQSASEGWGGTVLCSICHCPEGASSSSSSNSSSSRNALLPLYPKAVVKDPDCAMAFYKHKADSTRITLYGDNETILKSNIFILSSLTTHNYFSLDIMKKMAF